MRYNKALLKKKPAHQDTKVNLSSSRSKHPAVLGNAHPRSSIEMTRPLGGALKGGKPDYLFEENVRMLQPDDHENNTAKQMAYRFIVNLMQSSTLKETGTCPKCIRDRMVLQHAKKCRQGKVGICRICIQLVSKCSDYSKSIKENEREMKKWNRWIRKYLPYLHSKIEH